MTTERQTTAECPRCKELEKQLAELKAEVARLKKDSSTSSKPPSSDIVKKK
jgi:ribosomal protein L29